MLNIDLQIIVIKNKQTISANGDTILSANFTIPTLYDVDPISGLKTVEEIGVTTKTLADFQARYYSGNDAIFILNFANDIEITHDYKNLMKICKIKLPRSLNNEFQKTNLVVDGTSSSSTPIPMFGRGDRIIITAGYNKKYNEVFRGYITKIGVKTPLELECSDMMYFLQNMEFRYSPTELNLYGDRTKFIQNNKITLNNLIQCALNCDYNSLLSANQDVFTFPNGNYSSNDSDNYTVNRDDGKIAVYFDNGLTTSPFLFNKADISIAELIVELKKKIPPLIVYFDDFANLRFGLLYTNNTTAFVSDTPINFYFESNIIDESNMKLQRADDVNIKIRMRSKRSNPKLTPLYAYDKTVTPQRDYYGSGIGTIIREEAPVNTSQDDLNAMAEQLYKAQKYNGWTKESSFVTFGTPIVHIGNKIQLTSKIYPEKNGIYMCTGVKTNIGVNGYRQTIKVGAKISS